MRANSSATDSGLPASVATAMARSRCSSASQQPDSIIYGGQVGQIKHFAEVAVPLRIANPGRWPRLSPCGRRRPNPFRTPDASRSASGTSCSSPRSRAPDSRGLQLPQCRMWSTVLLLPGLRCRMRPFMGVFRKVVSLQRQRTLVIHSPSASSPPLFLGWVSVHLISPREVYGVQRRSRISSPSHQLVWTIRYGFHLSRKCKVPHELCILHRFAAS